jgi:hypothetical protein
MGSSNRTVRLRLLAPAVVAATVLAAPSTFAEDNVFCFDTGDREEELLELIHEVLRHRSSRRSFVNDVDPVRGRRENRLVAYKLRTNRVSVTLEDQSIDDLFDFLRRVTGLNFVTSRKARESLKDDDRRLSFSLRDLSVESLLNLVERQMKDYRFTVRYGAVLLVRREEYRPRKYLRSYNIRDLVRRPPDFPAPRLGLGGLEDENR